MAAIGAGLDIYQSDASLVIDIGGGTSDIAVLSMGEIVKSVTLKTAGDHFDLDILHYIKKTYKLLIGERTAEQLKVEFGTLSGDQQATMDIRGRDMLTGYPRTITLRAQEITEALRESAELVAEGVRAVLEQTPPELASDIIDRGGVLTGGGALLGGLDRLLADRLGIPVAIAEHPKECVALGTGKMLEAKQDIFRPRR